MKAFRDKRNSSGKYARERMKLLLASERIDCSPQMINMMRNDLIHVMNKYVNLDEKGVTLKIYGEPPVIQAVMPIHRNKEKKFLK